MAPIPRLLDYHGPAVLSYGFRPFYLLGSLAAALGIVLWIPVHAGAVPPFGVLSGRDWHVHELLYGYLAAVIAGYVLSSVPNWTGKLPVQGRPLLALVAVWLVGRLALAFSGELGWLPTLLLDIAFFALLTALVARESIAARSLRNAHILVPLAGLLAGNTLFHLEARWYGAADYGIRFGIAAVVMLIALIGGRIIPSFTRNWLARQRAGRLPSPVGLFDRVSLAVAAAALIAWALVPYGHATAWALFAAAALHIVRLGRWAGERAWRNPLIFVLHIGYAFVPAGFLMTGLAALGVLPPTIGLHAWTAGAMGVMTLAVMTRTSLGLTGRPRVAGAGTMAIYILVVGGALLRIWAGFYPSTAALHAAGALWAAAFLAFAVVYWRVLTGPRLDRRG